jgi:hypothetical protein
MNTREWLDDNGDFLFGKHQGESVNTIAVEDPHYLSWILETAENIDHEDRDIIETALHFRVRK